MPAPVRVLIGDMEWASVAKFCSDTGIPRGTLELWKSQGCSIEESYTRWTVETRKENGRSERTIYAGVTYVSVTVMAEAWGLTYHLFTNRIRRGWPMKRAIETPMRGTDCGFCFCISCDERKASVEFYKGNMSRCKKCCLMESKINKYGEEARELLNNHDGTCAICGCVESRGRGWATDHCHETGVVRGILCTPCNAGLGLFSDSVERLGAAIRYLEERK